MGLLLGVAQGSAEPPRVIVTRYEPPTAPKTPVLGLVGKGVTFDSGETLTLPNVYTTVPSPGANDQPSRIEVRMNNAAAAVVAEPARRRAPSVSGSRWIT